MFRCCVLSALIATPHALNALDALDVGGAISRSAQPEDGDNDVQQGVPSAAVEVQPLFPWAHSAPSSQRAIGDTAFVADWAPVPSAEQLQYVRDQASAATVYRTGMDAMAEQLAPAISAANRVQAMQDRSVELERSASQRQHAVEALRDAEDQRLAALPRLVQSAYDQASQEHEARVRAEETADAAHQARVDAEEASQRHLEEVREAVGRQRLVDRLRTAEDARVAEAASAAAQQAREDHERMEAEEARVRATARAAQDATSAAVREATVSLSGLATETIQQVADLTETVSQREQEAQAARIAHEHLQEEVREAQEAADGSTAAATLDRARADAANRAVNALTQNATRSSGRAAAASARADQDAANAASAEAEALAAANLAGSHEDAVESAAVAAVGTLRAAAEVASASSARTAVAETMARVAPVPFMEGVRQGYQR